MVGKRRSIADAVSAGGVVWRDEPRGEAEIVLCQNVERDVWALPKGMPSPGEDLADTAMREVREETGLTVEAVRELGSIDYWYAVPGSRVHKFVHYWLMRATGGRLDDHDTEFDAVEWVPVSEALSRLTYATDREIVERAMAEALPR